MRKVWLSKDDFELFHQDISPSDFLFFRTHGGAFKRMWQEQSRRFWSLYVSTFEHFIWQYGVMKDFPMKADEMQEYIDEIMFYIRDQFVDGKASTAKNLVMDSVIVTQHRHCIALLDKADYSQNPFYMKETREIFRQLFGSPTSKRTFMKVLCGFPVYIKFAGSAVILLRRWMSAEQIDSEDEAAKDEYFSSIHHKKCIVSTPLDDAGAETIRQMIAEAFTQPVTVNGEKMTLGESMTRDKVIKDVPAIASGTKEVLETKKKKEKEDEDGEKKKKKKKKKKTKSDKPPPVEGGEAGSSEPLAEARGKDEKEAADTTTATTPVKVAAGTEQKEETLPQGVVDSSDKEKKDSVDDNKEDKMAAKSDKVKKEEGQNGAKVTSVGDTEKETEREAEEVQQTSKSSSSSCKATGEDPQAVAKDVTTKKKLHTCGCCGKEETTPKTFKRCQKCRGKPDPKYYCSRDCQAKDWKTHKLDHA